MIQLVWDAGFKRAYKKRISSDALLKRRFWDALEQFEGDPFSAELRTHPLTGKANAKVLLIDIGTHEEVY